MSVEDDGLVVWAVPAVQLDTAAALLEGADVGFHRRFPAELVPQEVRVVRRVEIVVSEGLRHILVDRRMGDFECAVPGRLQVARKSFQRDLVLVIQIGGNHTKKLQKKKKKKKSNQIRP